MNFALFLVGLVVQTLCGSCWKTLERGFDGKGVAVLPWRQTINNVEEESDIYMDMLEQINKVRTQMSNLYKNKQNDKKESSIKDTEERWLC